MPIMSPIQRRSPGGRLLLLGIYVLLTFGAAWMVYPFLLLVSGSLKSETDIRQFDIVPRYLYDDEMLFRKFEEQRYGQLDKFMESAREPAYAFDMIEKPKLPPETVMRDWEKFMADAKSWPMPFLELGHNFGFKTTPEIMLEFRHRLMKTFPEASNTELGSIQLWPEEWSNRSYSKYTGPFGVVYYQMRKELPPRYLRPIPIEGRFIAQHLRPKYGSGEEAVKKLNDRWGTHYASLYDATLSTTAPQPAAQREDWWKFVQESLSAKFVRLAPERMPAYREALRRKYGEIAELNKAYGTSVDSWSQVAYPEAEARQVAFADVEDFLKSLKSPEGVSLDAPEFRWRAFLKQQYRDDLNALNQAFGTRHSSFDSVPMPALASDWQVMQANKGAILWDFLTRNFRIVYDYLSTRGRAFQNTVLFCALNIITALIVNPLAAYALSRFQPRWGFKVLFFLMATMAFPFEVTEIPNFLMLRKMGLLNTFAALVIPAAANGYSIFLLKGFFDSLPRDLYESANLDGANELRIFWSVTMPLSAPILAVIALGAFTSAYGAFMFALLVCQKESMWTLMVYIYQLQQWYGSPIIFASLVLAAIPTLLVFVFCQNIIMRGIVIPVEK